MIEMPEETNDDINKKKKYFAVLEIKPDASYQEIKNAYLHLKRLYSSEPAVLTPVADEISEEARLNILKDLEEAYNYLKKYYAAEEKEKVSFPGQWTAARNVPEFALFDGNALKVTREVLGVELKDISLFTGVPLNHLKNIELQRPDLLPPGGYIKVFLKKYAEYLSLDPKRVIADYLSVPGVKKKNNR